MKKPLLRLDLPLRIMTSRNNHWILNLNNFRNAHYRTLTAAKNKYQDAIVNQLQGRNKIRMRPIRLEYTYYKGSARRVDVANPLSIIDKFTCDALVKAEILPDDNTDIITEVLYRYGGIDRSNPRAELRIYSC
jgi:hypothetical protein